MILTLVLASFAGSFVGVLMIVSKRGGLQAALPSGRFLRSARSSPRWPADRSSPGTCRSISVMTQYGYALIGLTAVVTVFVAILTFAVLKFMMMCARGAQVPGGKADPKPRFCPPALQDALTRLQAQERATSARADASEQLSSQIVSSLTAGLLVVDARGQVQILNPAGRRMLAITADRVGTDYGALLAVAPPSRT
jgi:PAS domain-containing protein